MLTTAIRAAIHDLRVDLAVLAEWMGELERAVDRRTDAQDAADVRSLSARTSQLENRVWDVEHYGRRRGW